MRLATLRTSWCRHRILREMVRSFSSSQVSDTEAPRTTTKLNELEEELANRILFQDNNIVVLDKPNGLPMHALKYDQHLDPDVAPSDEEELSVTACLPGLMAKLDVPFLAPAYSQHRLYSGPIILAKHEESARMLQKYFRHTRAQKVFHQKYFALTVGIPEDRKQIVELSVRRENIHDWRLSVFNEFVSSHQRRERGRFQPVISHTMLDSNPRFDVALLQLVPTQCKWDLIQLYLSSILSPVLGDHVYSSRVAYVMNRPTRVHPQSAYPQPQILPCEAMRRALEHKDTASLPLHVHCYSVTVPVMFKRKRGIVSQNKTFSCPPPDFFQKTMTDLGLRLELD